MTTGGSYAATENSYVRLHLVINSTGTLINLNGVEVFGSSLSSGTMSNTLILHLKKGDVLEFCKVSHADSRYQVFGVRHNCNLIISYTCIIPRQRISTYYIIQTCFPC